MSGDYIKVYIEKSRPIILRYDYVKQLIGDSIITIVYVWSSKNLADIVIKEFSWDLVNRHLVERIWNISFKNHL